MIPKEAASSVFECPEGFEEFDDDCIIEEVVQDNSLKVLVVPPDNGNKELVTLDMSDVDQSLDQMLKVEEWAKCHYAIQYGPDCNVEVASVDVSKHDFKYMIKFIPKRTQEKYKLAEDNNERFTHPTSFDGLFGDVVEEVIEEVQLDQKVEEMPDFEEFETTSDVDTERVENNETDVNSTIDENNKMEENDEIERCYKDYTMEEIREHDARLDVEKHELSGCELALSDFDNEYKDDNADNSPKMEIEIGDSPEISQRNTRSKSKNGVELLMIYPAPPAKGGISVNTEDYKCLGEDVYLNDVIIDFYTKYILLEMLSPSDRKRTHIFSSHFFTRLARSYAVHDSDDNAIEAENRHAGVQRWTKNVNIFEKDFIVVPINEHSHWFLVIICFANLVGLDGLHGSDYFISGKEVQRPCILIFDSLGNKGKLHVVNILRSYLSVEFCTKMGEEKEFSKYTLKSTYVNVPQQTNATDCGLYALQYIENFFKKPIEDFTLPLKDLSNWFKNSVIVRKREEIANLITELAIEFSESKRVNLPDVKFPEVAVSDEEDISESESNSSQSVENPYANVTIRRGAKYQPRKNQFDIGPKLYYKLNSTLNSVATCTLDSKKFSHDVSEADSQAIDSESDSNISNINLTHLNNTPSTSKNFVGVNSDYIKSNRPVRKAVTRTAKILEMAKSIKDRKRNEDSTFYRKDNARKMDEIKSSTPEFSRKDKVLESSPWISKSKDNSSFSINSSISSERFYGYSSKNIDLPSQLKQWNQRIWSSSKDITSKSTDSKNSTLPNNSKSSNVIYLNESMRVKNPRITPIKKNLNEDKIRFLIVSDTGYPTLLALGLPKNDKCTVYDILSLLKVKLNTEIVSTYLTPDSLPDIDYIIKVFTKGSCRNVDDINDSSMLNNTTTINLAKDRTTRISFSCRDKKENDTKENQLMDMQQITFSLRRNIRIILVYPTAFRRESITITIDDFKRLNKNEYLNDIIIDFYLKYLTLETLSPKDQERIYVFNTYFYTRLSSPIEKMRKDETGATMHHSVVERWTKNVNIFEKDFVIIPVHQNAHWFLVIICYPKLIGTDVKRSYTSLPKASQYPCILVFDSLPSLLSIKRSVIVQDLKNYLRCEYAAKMGPKAVFAEDDIVVFYPDVPYQLNNTDCGLYSLQYAENFYKDFIVPNKLNFDFVMLRNWFDKELIKAKREKLKQLIIRLAVISSAK